MAPSRILYPFAAKSFDRRNGEVSNTSYSLAWKGAFQYYVVCPLIGQSLTRSSSSEILIEMDSGC
jgi:hypothetical protein